MPVTRFLDVGELAVSVVWIVVQTGDSVPEPDNLHSCYCTLAAVHADNSASEFTW